MAKLALLALAFTAVVALSTVSASITTTTVRDNDWPRKYYDTLDNDWPRKYYDSLDNDWPRKYYDSLDNDWPRKYYDSLDNDWPRKYYDSLDNDSPRKYYDSLDNDWPRKYYDSLDNPQKKQCRSSRHMQLNHCQMHLITQQAQGFIFNHKLKNQQQQQEQHLQQCCRQLKQVSQQCQCEAIEQVFNKSRQQTTAGDVTRMLSKAQRLPNDCGLEVQRCPITAPRG